MRALLLIVALAASLLAACGGGGASAPPLPHSSPPGGGSAPAAIYAQTATGTSTGGAPLFPGFTCSSPQTARTASASGTITQTAAANQSFNGESGLEAVTSTITLQGCADGPETVNETDYYHVLAVSGNASTIVVLTGSVLSFATYDGIGRTLTVTYGPNGLTAMELPLQTGRTWTNTAARTMTSTWGNTQETLDVNADGSYADRSVTLNGIFPYDSIATLERPDGSGSVTQIAGTDSSAPPFGVYLSAPVSNTVVVTPFGNAPPPPLAPTPTPCPTPSGTPCPTVTPTPYQQYAWYPYDPAPSQPLEALTTTDRGLTTLPPSCTVAKTFPASAELIETIDSTLDVWSGTSSETTDAYIDAQAGMLCLTVTLQQASYSFESTSADTKPFSTGSLSFTESLQSESVPPSILVAPGLARLLSFWR